VQRHKCNATCAAALFTDLKLILLFFFYPRLSLSLSLSLSFGIAFTEDLYLGKVKDGFGVGVLIFSAQYWRSDLFGGSGSVDLGAVR
jgi:hypothetical protein